MNRARRVAAALGAAVVVALISVYPLRIDGDQDCGGVTGRVAFAGSYNSGGGEQTPKTEAAARAIADRCQSRARVLLGIGAFAGALVGYTGGYLADRRRRDQPASNRGEDDRTSATPPRP